MSEKRMVKKSLLKFNQGYFVEYDSIVGIPRTVALQLNKLELMAQQYAYLKAQPKGQFVPMPSLDGFEKMSAFDSHVPVIEEPETPLVDQKVAEGLQFAEEINKRDDVREINKQLGKFAELFSWLALDEFPEGDWTEPLDLLILGNPLELGEGEVADLISRMVTDPVEFV